MKPLEQLLCPNIASLSPYSCARDEFSGKAEVFLDANESPYNAPVNRYPDPLQAELKAILSRIKGVPAENICLGNGSDETIDLVFRCFCRPGVDNVVAMEPTYGMYKVCADINNVEYRPVLLDDNYKISAEKMLSACDINTKVIWLCTPNNPTGNCVDRSEAEKIIQLFDGIVVVDEAYSDFSSQRQFRSDITKYDNIIVLNTMSKAWACAAIRLGMAFAQKGIIDVFNKVKYPYNINFLTQEYAKSILRDSAKVAQWVATIIKERERLIGEVKKISMCKKIHPTDANFFLAEVDDAQATYDYLAKQGIIVRNRTKVSLCRNCLRITVGTKEEDDKLLAALHTFRL